MILRHMGLITPPAQRASSSVAAARKMLLRARIPPGSWDSHMHVFDPERFPLKADAQYAPKPYIVSDALRFEASVGMHGIVLVQPSGYGQDNSCMLDALRQLGPENARAVVSFDPATTPSETIQGWHILGVRGVRINLQSVAWEPSEKELASVIHSYADAIRPLDWVIQIYAPLATIKSLETLVPSLGVRVCFDHIGHPTLNLPGSSYEQSRNPYELPGFSSLIRLLRGGNVFVKLSAAYRFSCGKDYEDVEPIAKEVLRVAGKNRVVFATDWPHTRFEGLDISPWMERVLGWCNGDQELIDRVFRDNARDLWNIA